MKLLCAGEKASRGRQSEGAGTGNERDMQQRDAPMLFIISATCISTQASADPAYTLLQQKDGHGGSKLFLFYILSRAMPRGEWKVLGGVRGEV